MLYYSYYRDFSFEMGHNSDFLSRERCSSTKSCEDLSIILYRKHKSEAKMSSEYLSLSALPHSDCFFLLPSLQYYTLRDIVNLDIAINNSKIKQVFIEILPTYYTTQTMKSNDEIKWLLKRKVNLSILELSFFETFG